MTLLIVLVTVFTILAVVAHGIAKSSYEDFDRDSNTIDYYDTVVLKVVEPEIGTPPEVESFEVAELIPVDDYIGAPASANIELIIEIPKVVDAIKKPTRRRKAKID